MLVLLWDPGGALHIASEMKANYFMGGAWGGFDIGSSLLPTFANLNRIFRSSLTLAGMGNLYLFIIIEFFLKFRIE